MYSTTLSNLSPVKTGSFFQKNVSTMVSSNESLQFLAIFPTIVQDLSNYENSPEVNSHISELLNYVVPGGKKLRGLTTIAAYKSLEKEENLTPENMKLAYVMGWMVEITQASLLIFDDIMDKSEIRRGVSCWYKKKNIGLNGINDGLLLKQSVYVLLEKYFHSHRCFLQMYRILNNVLLNTTIGQAQDCLCTKNGKPDFELFTAKSYFSLAEHKTAYYTLYFPVALAMSMANLSDEKSYNEAKAILLQMGTFFQIQDDFLDCFGASEATGKLGNDIREGKCTWLAVKALEKANITQKKIMEKYYGSGDPDAEEIIRNLYEELSLTSTYAMYEEENFNKIRNRIQGISTGLPQALFLEILYTIYRRTF